jgi:recombination protein RecA
MAPRKKPKEAPESTQSMEGSAIGEALFGGSPQKSAKTVKAEMNRRFGAGTFFSFEEVGRTIEIVPCPTGIPTFDYATGIGGFPMGRIVEIYGPESSGKTTLSLYAIAQFQKLARVIPHRFYGRKSGFIDAEHALDPIHVKAIGVDVSEETGMMINQPDNGEQGLNLVEAMCLSGEFGIIVVDSVAALVPKAEIEGEVGDQFMGLQARMMGQALRKISVAAYKSNTLVIFINQLREKIGVMHGNPETTPGGRALKFYASMRVDVRRKPIEKSSVFVGQATTAKIVKNKVSPPFKVAEYDYYWDGGVDMVKNIMGVAVDLGIIGQAGAYYYIGPSNKEPYTDGAGNRLSWQGGPALLDSLRVSPGLFSYVNDMVQGNIPRDAQMVIEGDDEDKEELEAIIQEAGGPDLFSTAENGVKDR